MKIGNLEIYGVIYKIINLVNSKVYIGQTIQGFDKRYAHKGENIEKVYRNHKCNKDNNRDYNKHLYNAIEKYGFKAFEIIKIFDIAFSKKELDIKEDLYIELYNCTRKGYNNMGGGSKGVPSEETRKKISESMTGKNMGAYNSASRKVICLNTNDIFNTITEASLVYNLNVNNISQCCNNKQKSCGISKDNILLTWRYYDDYLKMTEFEIKSFIKKAQIHKKPNKNSIHYKSIICITTLIIFHSCQDASLYANRNQCGITKACKNRRYSCGKLEDGTPLKWMYYEDYVNIIQEKNSIFKEVNYNLYKEVICITTYKIFKQQKEACEYYNIKSNHIIDCCKHKRNYCGKLEDGTKLQWKYIEDLTQEEYIKYDIENKLKELHNQDLVQAC